MVPANQIIELQARRQGNVKSVSLAAFRKYAGCEISACKCLHGFRDRMDDWLDALKVLHNSHGLFRWSILDFREDHVRNNALPTNAIEKRNKVPHDLRSVARLSRSKAPPNTGLEIEY
jgi:hypothetical protein